MRDSFTLLVMRQHGHQIMAFTDLPEPEGKPTISQRMDMAYELAISQPQSVAVFLYKNGTLDKHGFLKD